MTDAYFCGTLLLLMGKKHFVLCHSPSLKTLLNVYFFCFYSSVIEEYMSEKVQFVVTSEGWHESFEDVSPPLTSQCASLLFSLIISLEETLL